MAENEFVVLVRQLGIRCPKCGVVLTTDQFFPKGKLVKCTNLMNDNFEPCDFEGEVEYPVGVNFV